jgi:hypothetical protein
VTSTAFPHGCEEGGDGRSPVAWSLAGWILQLSLQPAGRRSEASQQCLPCARIKIKQAM